LRAAEVAMVAGGSAHEGLMASGEGGVGALAPVTAEGMTPSRLGSIVGPDLLLAIGDVGVGPRPRRQKSHRHGVLLVMAAFSLQRCASKEGPHIDKNPYFRLDSPA
jgi:hypothetical protein